jgi:endoglucanase
MKIVSMPRASVFGLCLALGAVTTGCMTDGSRDEGEASASSAITFDPGASYTPVGVQSNKCIGPVGGSTASGVQLEIETCTGTANQRWIPGATSGGYYQLVNQLSGLCMDVSGASIFPGTPVIQFTCHTGLNQQWSFADIGDGSERMAVRETGLVLDVTGQGTAPGTKLQQWFSNGGSNQHFVMNEAIPAIITN